MILIPQGKEYRCPKCGAHISPKPPPVCHDCGTPLEKPGDGHKGTPWPADETTTLQTLLLAQRDLHQQMCNALTDRLTTVVDLRQQVCRLQDELASLRQHQAGLVDAGELQEAERVIERLQMLAKDAEEVRDQRWQMAKEAEAEVERLTAERDEWRAKAKAGAAAIRMLQEKARDQ